MKETIENTETSFEKGIGLEKEFCEYLKTDLGWEKARIRSQMASNINMRGINVDIVAERINEKDKRNYIILGSIYLCIGTFVFLLGLDIVNENEVLGFSCLAGFFLMVLFAVLFYRMALDNIKEHAWVECKNRKTKSDIKQIKEVISCLKEYRATENRKYKFVEIYFVSASGFIDNAIELAERSEIRCFVKKDGTFKEVDKWNHN